MTLRVLLTHERFPPDYFGGGEYVVLETALGLQSCGVDVRVLTTGKSGDGEYRGIAVTRLPMSRYGFNLQVAAIRARLHDTDLVHTFTYHACLPSLVAARLADRPIVCEALALFGDVWHDMRGPLVGRAYSAWERLIVARKYDWMLFLSEASRNAGILLGASPARSSLHPPGIDQSYLQPSSAKRPLVVYAGQLSVRKGVQHLFEVARALPNVPFRAVGWADDLDGLITAAPPNLEIVPCRSNANKQLYLGSLREASIFFFPSYSETFGLVLAEAMACGCAIVSTVNTIGFAGEKVTPGDEPAMAAALDGLWKDPELVARLGAENRRLASAFSWEAHTERLLKVYAGVLRRDLSEHVGVGAAAVMRPGS